MIYATATWTWRKRIAEIELYNEPELEACWDSVFFVQQSVIRRDCDPRDIERWMQTDLRAQFRITMIARDGFDAQASPQRLRC